MRVRDVMSHPAIVVGEEATLEEAAARMLEHRIGCLPVVDAAGRLTGILTESDFATKERGIPFAFLSQPQLFGRWVQAEGVEPLYEEARRIRVSEAMSRPVVTVGEDDSVDDAVAAMERGSLKRIPVVRDGAPVGVVARHDLLRLAARRVAGR